MYKAGSSGVALVGGAQEFFSDQIFEQRCPNASLGVLSISLFISSTALLVHYLKKSDDQRQKPIFYH